jgi:hypothetical protein
MAAIVFGKTRGVSNINSDKLESMEIWVSLDDSKGLPFVMDKRVQVNLELGGMKYIAGLRATTRNKYVWICPDLIDGDGEKVSLARIVQNCGMGKNQRVRLEIQGRSIKVSSLVDDDSDG